jgi:hypothetical protein
MNNETIITHHNLLYEDREDHHVWLSVEIEWHVDTKERMADPFIVTVTDEDGEELAYFDWTDHASCNISQAVYAAYDEGEITFLG